MVERAEVYTVADHVTLWLAEGSSIHIKTREPSGDPVELSGSEAAQLVTILQALINGLG